MSSFASENLLLLKCEDGEEDELFDLLLVVKLESK